MLDQAAVKTLVSPTVITEPDSQRFLLDPGPFYRRLREDHPVVPARLPRWRQGWLITRYEDVATVLRDLRFVSDFRLALSPEQQRHSRPPVPKILSTLADNLLSLEGDRHQRVRALVAKAFTPRRIERMRERIHELAAELLDARAGASHMDLLRDYATPIPTRIILEMLGIEEGTEIYTTHRRAEALIALVEDLRAAWWAAPGAVMFFRSVRRLIRERRKQPRDDLLSHLIQAEEAGDTLSENELFATVVLLILAGHETTVNLIGIGMLALIQNPAQLARLRNEPALMPSAVEELLRYVSPLRSALRFTREEVTLSGVTIPQGAPVAAVILSANRDEQVFHDPETLDIARNPNRHLSLGTGRHFCLGATLARMEAEIALSTLLQRTVDLRLTVDPRACGWRSRLGLRMISSLPLSVHWRDDRHPARQPASSPDASNREDGAVKPVQPRPANSSLPAEPKHAAFIMDPFPYYERLRAEQPVIQRPFRRWRHGWQVLRYTDVETVLKDPRFCSDYRNALTPEQQRRLPAQIPGFLKPLRDNLLTIDGQRHARIRALAVRAFTPGRIEAMRPRIERLTEELLDAQHGRRRIDLVRDYATPLPTTVILDLLGVSGADVQAPRRWALALTSTLQNPVHLVWAAPQIFRLFKCIRDLIRARRREPRDDLLSSLLHAGEDGEALTNDELFATVMLLLLAGHETTANLIGMGILALLQSPGQLERLRENETLIRPGVEELMRFVSPVRFVTRFTREEVTLSGVTIPQGAPVAAVLLSANRDAAIFAEPDRLDVGRRPNRHLAFGGGPHYCLGAALARLEAEVALSALLRRTGDLRLAIAPVDCGWQFRLGLRMISRLPVTIGHWQDTAATHRQ